jgi:hypothetical protein
MRLGSMVSISMSMQSAGARVNALSYLPKWLILAAVIGAIAGG